jgi:CSLREA domain-containing protein
MNKTLRFLLAIMFIFMTFASTKPVQAAGMVVNTLADNTTDDDLCALREAIINANMDAQTHDDCPSGSGTDTITFSLSGTISLGSTLPQPDNSDGLTIDGAGQKVIISGSSAYRVLYLPIGSSLTINHLTISDGSVTGNFGAGIFNNGGSLTINNSTISGNSADLGAGGIYSGAGTLNIWNSTITGNTVSGGSGGGLRIGGGFVTVMNSTFSGNSASVSGGGIYQTAGTLTLNNSIVANSTSGEDCYKFNGNTLSGSNNIIETDSAGANACGTTSPINSDPALGALTDNGGPTQTHALNPSSPALGAGNVTTCAEILGPNSLDQRGVTRPQNGCDIGAFESNAQPGPSFVVNSSEDTTDGYCDEFVAGATDCTLREAITYAISIGGTDTITFADDYTITLGSELPAVTDTLTITGNGAGNTIIQGDTTPNTANWRVFFVGAGGNLTLNQITVRHGTCDGGCVAPNSIGGGVYVIFGGTLTLNNSLVSGNIAYDGGGGLYNSQGTVTITNSTFSANSSDNAGGAIVNQGTMTISNSTIASNTSANNFAGGIRSVGNTLNIYNSTISGNTSNGLVSDGANIVHESGALGLYNTIIANPINGGDCKIDGGTVTATNNLIESTGPLACNNLSNGTNGNIIGSDPELGPLTSLPGYFPLQAGSPAIDAGDDAICAAAPVDNTSQNGVTRPFGDQCDIGSAEAASLIDVTIGGTNQGSYTLAPGASTRESYSGINNGPVQVNSTNDLPVIAAERVIYTVGGVATSFSEMMALPADALDTTYWLPWYNNVDLDTQLRFGNVSGAPASVHVYIGGTEVTGSPFALTASGAGQSTRLSFAGVNGGPVQIVSDQPIVAAERVIYNVNGVGTSFSEMMALPASQLNTTYWLPWYNNVDLDTQLRIGNVSGAPASVHVYIGGVEMTGSPFALTATGAGQSTRVSFAGINNGPVQIVSDQPIVAAERVIYTVGGVATSFSEMMALPNGQVNTTYWLPWYNNVDLDTQLRIGNVSGAPASVHVYIGGVEMTGSPFALTATGAGQSMRVSFAGINNGPVQIVSDQNIVAAERVIYTVSGAATSFTEMMALPGDALDITYWLPWYNNVDLNTQLRFGVP